jgi:hypothetical protein|nr:MAG TPA: hypothetical protein [Caudoviricetes sp.]
MKNSSKEDIYSKVKNELLSMEFEYLGKLPSDYEGFWRVVEYEDITIKILVDIESPYCLWSKVVIEMRSSIQTGIRIQESIRNLRRDGSIAYLINKGLKFIKDDYCERIKGKATEVYTGNRGCGIQVNCI